MRKRPGGWVRNEQDALVLTLLILGGLAIYGASALLAWVVYGV